MSPRLRVEPIVYGSAAYRQECALREAILRQPLGLSLRDEDLAGERDQFHFGLVDEHGALLGCVIAQPLGPGRAKLRQMAIAGAHQGQGLGRRLLLAAEAWLAARGYRHLELHARQTAAGFYARLGYTAEGAEFIEVTVPHVAMHKRLPKPAGEAGAGPCERGG